MFERGLFTTEAEFQAHWCPPDSAFYFYRVKHAIAWAELYKPEPKPINSAIGLLLPIRPFLNNEYAFMPEHPSKCDEWIFSQLFEPDSVREFFDGCRTDGELGKAAERLFGAAFNCGLIRIPILSTKCEFVTNIQDQFAGKDFEISATCFVDVKYDGIGGLKGTGNLFVQTHEGDRLSGDAHRFNGRNVHRQETADLFPDHVDF